MERGDRHLVPSRAVYPGRVGPDAPRTSPLAVVLTVAAALGACGLAAAVMVPTMLGGLSTWAVFAAGVIVLLIALGGLWALQKQRDPTR